MASTRSDEALHMWTTAEYTSGYAYPIKLTNATGVELPSFDLVWPQ
jgi:hypothetical protein